ncbi:hypothetical protein P9250_22055 [Caballeronia sp. LP006]|uniref:hypothetical protein n=1 Tax=Caballeronia sp. LP006 TaxID=3038552 RepID=UPI002858677F|nr:hypothetical protein [Caballeronia sp. LP006]MDR5830563.1 hypothetical protein [Caballeronia sp. LP006]
MKAPAIDLHRANRPGVATGLIALALGVVVLFVTMQYRDKLKEQGAALDEREASVAQEEKRFERIGRAHRGMRNPRADALMAQQRYAAEPARSLIEGGWQPNIAMLSLDIVTASRTINMQFETRSAQEAISYADWLQAQPAAESVSIKRQSEKPGPPVKTVETALQVTWRPFATQAATGASAPDVAASSAGGSR